MDTKQEFTHKITKIIRRHLKDKKLNGTLIGTTLGISRMQVHRLLKEHHNCHTGAFIMKLRLQQVQKELINSDKLVKTIAEETGFSDASYLTKVFKQHFGVLPKVFRYQNRL